MPCSSRAFVWALALGGGMVAAPVCAQSSPYLSLDDPRLPLLEHLIARGVVTDPTPMVRPFRVIDAVRALAAADTSDASTARLVDRLLHELTPPKRPNTWSLAGRAGGQAYTHARRDLLHPAGAARIRSYAEIDATATIGPFALVSRPAGEPRLLDDPDWTGQRGDKKWIGRMIEAYGSAQFGWGSIFYGLLQQNWGPVGLPGIGLSNYSYGREAAGFDVGTRDLRLRALAADLEDESDSAGQIIHKYFFAHRLGARFSDRLLVALWETTVLAGPDRKFDGRFRNPFSILLLANQYGQGDDSANVLIGFDVHWRAFRRATLHAQIGIDDIQYQNRSGPTRYPDRWALTLAGFGPLGRELAWRAFYTQASSLAFRTLDPFESFTERGVGLGRNFADMDQLTVSVSIPLAQRWLVSPDLTLLRQGEGEITDPFPATPEEAGMIPQIFIGVVERTWRLGVGISGRQGPLDLQADAGLHHIQNWRHEEGRTVNRFEGRLQATIGLRRQGILR